MKRTIALLLTIFILCSLCACGAPDEPKPAPEVIEPQPAPMPEPAPEPEPEPEPEPVVYTLYLHLPDGSGGFAVTEETAQSDSPAALIGALARAGVLAPDVSANSMENISGGIRLDLNDAFQLQLAEAGPEGEQALLGSVVNSFLGTFDGNGLLITINHQTLMGLSEPYDFYFQPFASYPVMPEEPAPEVLIPEVPAAAEQIQASSTAEAVAALAQTLIGAPFEWGAAGPDTFDNSGYVCYCFAQNGVAVPRITADMLAGGLSVEREALLPGDLVFFSFDGGAPSYVGIYIGGGQFISESSSASVMVRDMASGYYSEIFVCARRYA